MVTMVALTLAGHTVTPSHPRALSYLLTALLKFHLPASGISFFFIVLLVLGSLIFIYCLVCPHLPLRGQLTQAGVVAGVWVPTTATGTYYLAAAG